MSKRKIQIELHQPGDGRVFLNYWDFMRGDDVCAEVRGNELFVDEGYTERKITITEFIELVNKSANE